MKRTIVRLLSLTSLLMLAAPGFARTPDVGLDGAVARLLEDEARPKLAGELPARWTLDVRVTDGVTRVYTTDPYHPATFRAGPLTEPRAPFTDATYKSRIELRVTARNSAGEVTGERRFTGWSAKVTRFPPPHPYRTFDSIHALGKKHEGCAIYPEETRLFQRAMRDALKDASAWLKSFRAVAD